MMSKTTQQILAQNAGRDFDRLTLKFSALRRDAFAFFRGTNSLFLGSLPRRHSLFNAPRVLLCGDLHLENFGAFKGDNRLCYFDLNDFDEACLAPFTVDMVRFIASIEVASGFLGMSRAQTALLINTFLHAYTRSIKDGKPRWIERSLAQGVFRALLRRAMRRTRLELLARFTRMKDGKRRIRIDGARTLALDVKDAPRLKRFLAHVCIPGVRESFFKLLDSARRVAGCGSLGLARYVLLVKGRGSPDQNFALDLKYAAPSAVAEWLQAPQPDWHSEAARVVAVQRIVQAISPALLAAVDFDGKPFVLKELQPAIDRLDLALWRGKPRRILQAVEGMGHVTAWAHLRGCGHFGGTSPEILQSYVESKRWRGAVLRMAATAARRNLRDWRIYSKDYDAGAVHAAAEIKRK